MNCELQSMENELDRTKKEKDVEYKTKEAGCLDQAVTELSSVGVGVQSKHDVIHTYLGELRKLCIVEPETYAEHTMRRKAERVPRVVPLYRAEDEQETPASTRTFARARKPVSRVCACAGVTHWHPRRQTSEVNLKAAKADFAKSEQKLLDEIDTLDEGDCNS